MALAAMMCGSGPPSTMGQPLSMYWPNSFVDKHDAAARSAQGLVGRRRDYLGVGEGTVVAGEHAARDEPREVGHVHHEHRADLVGDGAHALEIDGARIGAVAREQDQRLTSSACFSMAS